MKTIGISAQETIIFEKEIEVSDKDYETIKTHPDYAATFLDYDDVVDSKGKVDIEVELISDEG